MGSVYEGENLSISRRVAIKILHNELQVHPQAIERFEREAQAAGKIGNDHILEVLDLGDLANGDRFMVMEYLDGESLEDRLDRLTMLTGRETVPLVRQLLVGLGAAHDKGIIHRDLKPENVFILKEKAGQPDFVKLIDFGISKFTATADMRMTATGAVMGTPFYMSPEQAKGSREIDIRADLYAVGVILYRCVTGEVPFPGENFNEVLFKVVLSQPRNPRDFAPNLEPGFETLIERAMAREPAHRFQTSAEFIAALDTWARDGRASFPTPSRTSVNPASHSLLSSPSLAVPSIPGMSPSATVAVPMDSQAVMASPNGITTGEWTQSGLSSPRSSSAKIWIFAVALLGAAALVGGLLFINDGTPGAAHSTDPIPSVRPEGPNEPLEPSRLDVTEGIDQLSKAEPSSAPSVTASVAVEDAEPSKAEPEPKDEAPRKKRVGSRVPRMPPGAGATEPPPAPPKTPGKKEPDFGY
jgi:eukaryotic-like serine/threonine-protein kinase